MTKQEIQDLFQGYVIVLLWVAALTIGLVLVYGSLQGQINDLPKKVCHNETNLINVTTLYQYEIITSEKNFTALECSFAKTGENYCNITKEVCELK